MQKTNQACKNLVPMFYIHKICIRYFYFIHIQHIYLKFYPLKTVLRKIILTDVLYFCETDGQI